MSSSSSCGARNSSSTTHLAGNTTGRSATAVAVCATTGLLVEAPCGCGCRNGGRLGVPGCGCGAGGRVGVVPGCGCGDGGRVGVLPGCGCGDGGFPGGIGGVPRTTA